MAGGLTALQTATIASALPFTIIMILMCWGLLSALRIEAFKRAALRDARVAPAGPHAARNWRSRLRAAIHHPKREEVIRFLDEVVRPALNEVADEFRRQNLAAEVSEGEDGRVWVEVRHGDEIDFFYSVRPRPYEPPTFVMRDTRSSRLEALKYFRAEVHLKEGGQDYDVMGWSQDAVINDVIEQYERHMHFLASVRIRRSRSLPPWVRISRSGWCSSSRPGSRAAPSRDNSPGRPALTTRRPLRDSRSAGYDASGLAPVPAVRLSPKARITASWASGDSGSGGDEHAPSRRASSIQAGAPRPPTTQSFCPPGTRRFIVLPIEFVAASSVPGRLHLQL
jgi:hypothetical protein